MFYSMSLAMGIMITFGSYLSKDTDIERSVKNVEIFDTAIAILAAFMIIPAVFAFPAGDTPQFNQGAGLMFITLPKVFLKMPFGQVIGGAFFILVAFAAFNIVYFYSEVLISTLCDICKVKRIPAVLIVVASACILGIPASLGYGALDFVKILGFSILDFMDFIANSLLLPLAGLATCVVFGWFVGLGSISDEIELTSKFKRKRVFIIVVKYLAPVFLGVIMC